MEVVDGGGLTWWWWWWWWFNFLIFFWVLRKCGITTEFSQVPPNETLIYIFNTTATKYL